MFKLDLEKTEEPEICLLATDIANILWIIEKAGELQKKNIYICFIDYTKAFDCGSKQIVENSQRDGNTKSFNLSPERQEATVRTEHGTTNWFKIGEGVR